MRNKSLCTAFRAGDAALIGAILAAALLLLLLPGRVETPASLEVRYDGGSFTLPLSEDGAHTLSSGGYTLTFQVREGGVQVCESDCPGEDCVHSGRISRAGQSIVCLPARVILKLTGEVPSDVDWVVP